MIVLEFLMSHPWVPALALVPLVIAALRVIIRRRQRRLKEEELSQIKRRNEALYEALRNPLVAQTRRGEDAMEITWDDKAVSKEKDKAVLMAELVELSGHARRKYVFRVDGPIRIGSGPENRMVLARDGVAKEHCELFMSGTKPCIRSLSGAKTVLRRGKTNTLVGQDGVYLQNGDYLQLGSTGIQFRLFRA